jgi:hypothetical protein
MRPFEGDNHQPEGTFEVHGMRVLIFEENLMWAPRLAKSVKAFGHEAIVLSRLPDELPTGDVAIVNLSSRAMPPSQLVPMLRAAGIKVLAHAGHKETELLELGKGLGCDRLASNGEITNKIGKILEEF